jgi:hypothetical protein
MDKANCLKAGAGAVITDTGAYEGTFFSAVYEFGKDGSQSQALVFPSMLTDKKPIFHINFLGRDGSQNLAWGHFCASVGCSGKDAPATTQGQNGTEWFLPAGRQRAGFSAESSPPNKWQRQLQI